MNNSISIMKNEELTINNSLKASFAQSMTRFLAFVAAWYSTLLGENVSIQRAKAMISAQCAFMALVMPLDLGYAYRVLALAWFAAALLRCRSQR